VPPCAESHLNSPGTGSRRRSTAIHRYYPTQLLLLLLLQPTNDSSASTLPCVIYLRQGSYRSVKGHKIGTCLWTTREAAWCIISVVSDTPDPVGEGETLSRPTSTLRSCASAEENWTPFRLTTNTGYVGCGPSIN